MAYRLRASAFCWLVLATLSSDAIATNIRVIPEDCRNVEIAQKGDVFEIRTTSKDAFLVGDLVDVGPRDRILQMEYFATDGVRGMEVFLGVPFSEQTKASLPPIPVSETWSTYKAEIEPKLANKHLGRSTKIRLDLGVHSGVRLQIRGLHLRPPSADDRRDRLEAKRLERERNVHADQINQYLKQRFPDRIESVAVSSDAIKLSGKKLSSEMDTTEVQIFECPPWTDSTQAAVMMAVQSPTDFGSDSWNVTVPRFDGDRDRLHSSWRLAVNDRWISARRFPTAIQTVGNNHVAKRPVPANQKGLGGLRQSGPLEDLSELGITAVTVNITLSSFLSDRPGPRHERISLVPPSLTFGGDTSEPPPVYFNAAAFDNYDALMNLAREKNFIVTAVVLIPTAGTSTASSSLIHPATDGGAYAMPNLTDWRWTTLYAVVLDRLAKRYSNPSKAPGGITNWIAHNEVDQHRVWTNMGSQPRALVTESYYRSMRMIYNAARTYNPHARVFASLTHSWMVPDDATGSRLAPREVLVALQRYSILEGDFDWGVAYHPYPENLFAETAWNDKKVNQSLSTPMITIQNIEVLDKFMTHPLMLDSSRNPRSILLSEQGFHTDSYSDQAQANQAASLVYAMSKIAKLKTIESFHYHRWVDNPNEGGLKLGLRTLPSPGNPHGEKKQSWFVYQAIGTPTESKLTRNLPGPDR